MSWLTGPNPAHTLRYVKYLIATFAVLAAGLGLAAPAHAETVDFAITTNSSGNCVAKINYQAGADPRIPGRVVKSVTAVQHVGIPGISSECSVAVTLKWRNLDTGVGGQVVDTVKIPNSCGHAPCSHSGYLPTGAGRVALELSSPFDHTPGKAEIVAYP